MLVPSAETDFVGDFRRKTYHLHFLHLKGLALVHSSSKLIVSVAATSIRSGGFSPPQPLWTRGWQLSLPELAGTLLEGGLLQYDTHRYVLRAPGVLAYVH